MSRFLEVTGAGVNSYLSRAFERGSALISGAGRELNFDRIDVFVPDQIDVKEKIPSLERGGVAKSEEAMKALIALSKAYLISGERNVVIFEDPLARPTDKFLDAIRAQVAIHNGEVYYVARSSSVFEGTLESTVRAGQKSVGLAGVFTKWPDGLTGGGRCIELSTAHVDSLIASATDVVIGCFDGEGFLRLSVAS